MYNDNWTELYHHGIKGQKWGVRRYQNADGTLTVQGRERYLKLMTSNGVSKKDVEARLSSSKGQQEAAEYLARRNKRIKTAIAIGAGIGLAAAGVTAYKLYGSTYLDQVVRSGKTMQTLSVDPNRLNQGSQIYAAINKYDKKHYEAFFGEAQFGNKVKHVMEATKDLKIASRKNGRKAFNELMKDKDFARMFREEFDYNVFNVGEKAGGLDDYKKFNIALVSTKRGAIHAQLRQKYYDLLKSKGYAGVIDENDVLSGFTKEHRMTDMFGAKAPTVLFDRSGIKDITKTKTENKFRYNPATGFWNKPYTEITKERLSNTDIVKARNYMEKHVKARIYSKKYAPYIGTIGGMGIAATTSAANDIDTDKERKKYKKKNKK